MKFTWKSFLLSSAVITIFVLLSFSISRVDDSTRILAPSTQGVSAHRPVHRSKTVSTPAPSQTAAAQTNERFPGSVVLDTRDSSRDHNGRFTRLELLQTKMTYPFLRVEQLMEWDPATQTDRLVHEQEMSADHVVVELVPGTTESDFFKAIRLIGGTVRRKLQLDYSRSYLVALPHATLDAVPDAVKTLALAKGVFTFAEPDYVSHKCSTSNDPDFDAQWHLKNTGQTGGFSGADIDAVDAWSLQTGNSNIVIAISDSGIDYNHIDLQGNVWRNPNEVANGVDDDGNGFIDDVRGWNFVSSNNDPFDDFGHGTFVSGVIGASGNNGTGIAGVCWQCRLIPVKILDNFGYGYNSWIAEGFNYARRNGAKIINASHGGPGSSVLKAAVNDLQTNNVILVAASANDSRNEDVWLEYPASYTNQNVIAVGASDKYDHIAWFSNYGANTIDVFAPGDDIWSTQPGNGYGLESGASFATPQVAAVAGLLIAQHPSWTVKEIKNDILRSVDLKISFLGQCSSGGRLNAYRAIAGLYNDDPGNIDLSFNPNWTVNGAVMAMALQKDGRLLVGGTMVNTVVHGIARLNADGFLDTSFRTGAGANGAVNAIALQPDGKILIAGAFTKYNTIPRNRVARLNSNGTLDTTFNPGTGADGIITSLLLQPDGQIIIGGEFLSYNNVAHANIARLNIKGSLDESFISPGIGVVRCLALQSESKILFGGDSVGRLQIDGSIDSGFNAGANVNGTVRTISVDASGSILIGGDFTSVDGTARNRIARLSSNGALETSFNPGTGANGGNVNSIVAEDDCTILVAGSFTDFNDEHLNSSARRGIVRLLSDGSVDQNFRPGIGSNAGVDTILPLNEGHLYLGGSFTTYNSFASRYVARIVGRDLTFGTNSFSLSTNNVTFGPEGGFENVTVTTLACASWKTFVKSNNWLTVQAGAVGSGSGDVVILAAPNTNGWARSGSLTVAGQTVSVQQPGTFAPPSFAGKTLLLNQQLFITTPTTNGFVSRISTDETFGTYVYSRSTPTNALVTYTDSFGTDTIILSFDSPSSGTYTNTRGSSGPFTLSPTRPDFDGDSRADLLWVNSTNAVRAWFLEGTNFLGANRIAATKNQSLAWKLVAANDFNLDGQTDLLWQNSLGNLSLWLLNQTNLQKTMAFGSSGAYKVIGMTDLNDDGKKDLVFETSTGYLLGWYLQGTNRTGVIRLNHGKPVPRSLKAVGFDDFNHDGQSDLLWQSTNNVLSVWYMNGTNFTGTNVLNGGVPITNGWQVVAINDFNYDGNPDLVFENTDGQLWIWLMHGTDVLESFFLQPAEAVDPKWRVAGPK